MKIKLRVLLWIPPLLLLLAVVLVGVFLSQGKVLEERHTPFVAPGFDYANGGFSDYISWSQAHLRAARLDNPSNAIIENLGPFELLPAESCPRLEDGRAERGVVLIPGLFESAYVMRDIGSFLQAQCFHVLGLLLPAHATRPGDFLRTRWQHWAEAVHFATEQLASKAGRVVVAGHSAAGTLSILEAARNPQVDALILFAPALGITEAAKYARLIVPIGKLFPKAAWVSVYADEAIYRYESFTYTSAAEVHALIQSVQAQDQSRVHQLPVFTVASLEDTTVSTPRILDFMRANTNIYSNTLLYSQHPEQGTAYSSERVRVLPSENRSQGILSTSHLGLMTPPGHPHYGRDGVYRNCGHYGSAANPDFIRCKNGERTWYGETTRENREQGLLERIAFNPYYETMLEELRDFLRRL